MLPGIGPSIVHFLYGSIASNHAPSPGMPPSTLRSLCFVPLRVPCPPWLEAKRTVALGLGFGFPGWVRTHLSPHLFHVRTDQFGSSRHFVRHGSKPDETSHQSVLCALEGTW